MADGNILSDFGIDLLEEEIDDVIFQTNEFPTDATFTGLARSILVDIADVHGAYRPVRYRHGGRHGVQNDGQARAFGRDEALQTAGSCRSFSAGGILRQTRAWQTAGATGAFRFPLLYPELRRFVHI